MISTHVRLQFLKGSVVGEFMPDTNTGILDTTCSVQPVPVSAIGPLTGSSTPGLPQLMQRRSHPRKVYQSMRLRAQPVRVLGFPKLSRQR